jgi:hypothetical protein
MSETKPAYRKQDIRARMEGGLAQLFGVIDQLTDDQKLAVTDAAGWNIRDHLAHLAVWADGIAALLRREDRWAAMGLEMEDPEGDEPDYDLLNAQIVQQHREISPERARAWLAEAQRGVLEAMESLQESELSDPYERFVPPFTGNWGYPIAEYILGNTEDHYDEHKEYILRICARISRIR